MSESVHFQLPSGGWPMANKYKNIFKFSHISKIQAFLIHLCISAIIFIICLMLILFFWYPEQFFLYDGGWQGVRIIVMVDMVLGPLLTLLLYKPGKRGLVIDMTFIVVAQTMALTWGIWQVYSARPVLLVFDDGQFYSLTSEQVARANPPGNDFADRSTRIAMSYLQLPGDAKEQAALGLRAYTHGQSRYMLGQYYVPLDAERRAKVFNQALDSELIQRKSALVPEAHDNWERFVEQHKDDLGDYVFFPLQCRYGAILLYFDRHQETVLKTLNVRMPRFLFLAN